MIYPGNMKYDFGVDSIFVMESTFFLIGFLENVL